MTDCTFMDFIGKPGKWTDTCMYMYYQIQPSWQSTFICTLQDDWLGIVHHVTGEHEWADGQCNHGQLIEAEHDAPLLQKDSKAHEAIRNVVLDPRFLNTLDHYVMFRYVSVYLWFNFYFIHWAAMAPVCLTYFLLVKC